MRSRFTKQMINNRIIKFTTCSFTLLNIHKFALKDLMPSMFSGGTMLHHQNIAEALL